MIHPNVFLCEPHVNTIAFVTDAQSTGAHVPRTRTCESVQHEQNNVEALAGKCLVTLG